LDPVSKTAKINNPVHAGIAGSGRESSGKIEVALAGLFVRRDHRMN
jgi:hypothetical protein